MNVNDLCCTTINVGLELEYEGVGYEEMWESLYGGDNDEYTHWNCELDHSLRPTDYNTELKFRIPQQGQQIILALEQLSVLDDYAGHIDCSWRCGMHVHVDYTGVSYQVAHNTLILSALLEPVLFAFAGPARKESKFCQPTSQLGVGFATGRDGKLLGARKYSAVNVRSVLEKRSVEFRYADSTTDRQVMLDYINVNMALRLASERFASGWELVESVLAANSRVEWINQYMHPIAAAILTPIASRLEMNYPWSELAPAIVKLAEHQEGMPKHIIGGV